jgi:hypothetical protein
MIKMSHTGCTKCGKQFRHDHFDDHGHHDFHHHNHREHHDFRHHNHREHHDFRHHNHCNHYHDSHHHNRDFFCDRFICDSDFRLRLGGLQGGLNFRLRQLIGSVVKLELEENKEIVGNICFVGSDFVEVDVLKEKKEVVAEEKIVSKEKAEKKRKKRKKIVHGNTLIFPFKAIKFVELKDDCDCKN